MVFKCRWTLLYLGSVWLASGGWGEEDGEDEWACGSTASASHSWEPGAATALPPSSTTSSSQEVMMHMASAWDEELCLYLQEEEIAGAEGEVGTGPEPSLLPLPFAVSSGVRWSQDEPSSSSSDMVSDPSLDWLDVVRDRRRLRQRGQNNGTASGSETSQGNMCRVNQPCLLLPLFLRNYLNQLVLGNYKYLLFIVNEDKDYAHKIRDFVYLHHNLNKHSLLRLDSLKPVWLLEGPAKEHMMLRELKKELQLGALVVLGVGARAVTAGITLMAASLTWGDWPRDLEPFPLR
eukprot:s4525_g2.t1